MHASRAPGYSSEQFLALSECMFALIMFARCLILNSVGAFVLRDKSAELGLVVRMT
jgi:hypothetical protein